MDTDPDPANLPIRPNPDPQHCPLVRGYEENWLTCSAQIKLSAQKKGRGQNPQKHDEDYCSTRCTVQSVRCSVYDVEADVQ